MNYRKGSSTGRNGKIKSPELKIGEFYIFAALGL
jgi:hypothetical protein